MSRFSIQQAVGFGWQVTKQHLVFLIGIILLAGLVQYTPSWMGQQVRDIPLLAALSNFIAWLLQLIIGLGLLRVALNFHDAKSVQITDLFSQYKLLLKYLLASILYGLIVFGGTLLFIVPGIIWAIKYQFYGYLIVDQNLGPIEAIKKSGQMTQGSKWQLLGLGFVLVGIQLLGALCLMVGLLVTIPIGLMAVTHVYRTLQQSAPQTV